MNLEKEDLGQQRRKYIPQGVQKKEILKLRKVIGKLKAQKNIRKKHKVLYNSKFCWEDNPKMMSQVQPRQCSSFSDTQQNCSTANSRNSHQCKILPIISQNKEEKSLLNVLALQIYKV